MQSDGIISQGHTHTFPLHSEDYFTVPSLIALQFIRSPFNVVSLTLSMICVQTESYQSQIRKRTCGKQKGILCSQSNTEITTEYRKNLDKETVFVVPKRRY